MARGHVTLDTPTIRELLGGVPGRRLVQYDSDDGTYDLWIEDLRSRHTAWQRLVVDNH